MRLLLHGINYAPELTGIGKYSGDLGAWLARNNHEVEVITAPPYYPQWQIADSYQAKGWFSEQIDGVKVHRAPLYVPRNVSSFRRIMHGFSFVINCFPYWMRALFQQRFDVVICVAPAFHLAFFAILYAKIRRVPLLYHIQDLQVDAAKDLGMITNKALLTILFKAEKFILNRSAKVSTISQGMLARIQAKGISSNKCVLFPNWVDETHVRPIPKADSLRAVFGLEQTDKIVLYAGALGEKQGLELIVEAARALRHEKNLYFLIVGSGGGKEKLEKLVERYALTNVLFFPLQPYQLLSAVLATADVHLVLQKKSASDLVMPSKLTSILAAGGCSIVTALPGTTLYEVVDTHKIGLLVQPESVDALCAGIEQALSCDLESYRTNARLYAERYLSRENILREFEQTLLQTAHAGQRRQKAAQMAGQLADQMSSIPIRNPATSD